MTEELKPEAAPVEPLCPFTDRPAWECAAACTCAHFKPTGIIKHAHPPAAPTDALVEKVAELEGALQSISDLIGDAAQDDCENGVRWLNERAAAAYLKDFPATLTALRKAQEIIDAVLP